LLISLCVCGRSSDASVGPVTPTQSFPELRAAMGKPEPEGWGCKPATVNLYMSAISKALSEAVDLDKLEVRPKIPYVREPKHKLRWITPEEETTLLAHTVEVWTEPEAGQMRALVEFLVNTSARLSEALKAGNDRHQRMAVAAGARQVAFVDTKNGTSKG
jgi:hypothetical protein